MENGQGNVHSGATPPWMLDDSGNNKTGESRCDYVRHRRHAVLEAIQATRHLAVPLHHSKCPCRPRNLKSRPWVKGFRYSRKCYTGPSLGVYSLVFFIGTTIPTIPNTLTIQERQQLINKSKKVKNPRKIGANNVNTNYSANWVPNFGRVFNEGPRSETRKEFREELVRDTICVGLGSKWRNLVAQHP